MVTNLLIDSHCHLDFSDFTADIDAVISRAVDNNVRAFVVPGVQSNQWSMLKTFQQQHDSVFIALGCHPYFLDKFADKDLEVLAQLASQNWVCAIGECGIDGYLAEQGKSHGFLIPHQQQVFEAHIDIANITNKPLIVHHRKSHHLILQSFKRIPPKCGGIIHAFSGSLNDAKRYIDLGFKLGCGGTITYPRAQKTRHVFTQIDLSDIVLETDSPDMPLNGQQGLRNEPKNVKDVAEALALLRNDSFASIEATTSDNLMRTLGIRR